MYVLHNTCYMLQFLYGLAQALQQKINDICYKQNRLTTFQQQAETKSSAGKVQFVFKFNLQNQSIGWFSLLQNNSTKVLEHRTRKEYNSICGLAFWLPCETHGMDIIKSRDMSCWFA